MYIAKSYFETKFNKIFMKGDVVPNDIAKVYLNKVIDDGEDTELLIETPTDVTVEILEESKEESKEEPKEESKEEPKEEPNEESKEESKKKSKKKIFGLL